MRPGAQHKGFTLVEMLAVVAIMTLVAATLTVSIAGMDGSAALHSAAWRFSALDAQARLEARSAGQVLALRTAEQGATVRIEALRIQTSWRQQADRFAALELPRGVRIELRQEGVAAEPLDAVLVDALGRSVDYRAALHGQDQREWTWRISGLSGQFTRVDREGEAW